MKKPKYWSLAKKTLSKKDKVIKKIIATHSGSLVSRSDPFFSLCRSIIGQQISVIGIPILVAIAMQSKIVISI